MWGWAKFPSKWLNLTLHEEDALRPLKGLEWRGHRNAAVAALVILMLLAIRLNQSRRGRELVDAGEAEVAVTWDDMRAQTGFARATIGKGIALLEATGAISVRKSGRVNLYTLKGVGEKGGWCQLPQAYLLNAFGGLSHLKGAETNRVVLNGLKIYVLLLALRRQQFNTAAVSYSGITRHTGVRRADISKALSWLVSLELVHVSEDTDSRSQEDFSRRYRIEGLTKAA